MSQFNDEQFFMYPPFNRDHTWHKDYDYEIPVISSVGNGPKGDMFTWDDMTDDQKNDLVDTALAQHPDLKGDPGDSAYDVAGGDGVWGSVENWLASLKGDTGDSAYELAGGDPVWEDVSLWLASLKGDKGDWDTMDPEDRDAILQAMASTYGAINVSEETYVIVTGENISETNAIEYIDISSVANSWDIFNDVIRINVDGLELVRGQAKSTYTYANRTLYLGEQEQEATLFDYRLIRTNNVTTSQTFTAIQLHEPIVHPDVTIKISRISGVAAINV